MKAFNEEDIFHILLLAQMQMGKSGTYWYVILNTLFDKSNGIENVIIISGNREIELHQQVHDDKAAYRKWFLNLPETTDAYSKEELKEMKVKSKKNIQILWGSQLQSMNNAIPNNTLIVWDEAHYAQSENNSPDKFFKSNNLDTLINGTVSLDEIKTRNIKILNVSATPFSELVVNRENNPLHKVVKLEPGTNYFGMEYYSNNKYIHPSFVISDENTTLLKNTLLKHNNAEDPKYILIRVTEKTKYSFIRAVCEDLQYDCKFYNSVRKDIELDVLQTKPNVSTVIIISGMLRMGKVIHKNNISVVFEESTKKEQRKIDTGFQGLLGRVCGYSPSGFGFNIHIYVENSILENVEEYLDNYNSEHGPYCSKAMNTRTSSVHNFKSKQTFALYEIPYENGMLTNKQNISKPYVKNWLNINLLTLKLSDAHETKMQNILKNDEQLVAKNVNMKSNKGFYNMIYDNTDFTYRDISENVYILNDYEKVWLLIYSDTLEDEYNDNTCAIEDIYVLDKCVFKSTL